MDWLLSVQKRGLSHHQQWSMLKLPKNKSNKRWKSELRRNNEWLRNSRKNLALLALSKINGTILMMNKAVMSLLKRKVNQLAKQVSKNVRASWKKVWNLLSNLSKNEKRNKSQSKRKSQRLWLSLRKLKHQFLGLFFYSLKRSLEMPLIHSRTHMLSNFWIPSLSPMLLTNKLLKLFRSMASLMK